MASADSYRGPVSLAASRYATPQHKARLAPFPSAIPSPTASKATNGNGSNTAGATKEQLAINDAKGNLNPDAQLAMAQNENLRKEIEKHSAKVTKSVYSALASTRQLLTLLRDSIRKENPASAEADLKAVDALWSELERLFEAAQEANTALPTFLEKQRDNMNLYLASVVNEAFQESQDELNAQHKKVNLQHTLILEHQQAFQNYKADVMPKLKDLTDLQERVSRLTLDKGLLRTELDKIQQQLTAVQAKKDEDTKKTEEVQKELDQLISAKKALATEGDTLRKTISDLQDKVKAAEHKAKDYYEQEIRRITKQCSEELEKTKTLDALVKDLRSDSADHKKANEKLKSELSQVQEKYKNQSAEFSNVFMNLTDQNKKVTALTSEVERLKKRKLEVDGRLIKLDTLEKEAVELRKSKEVLQIQLNALKTEFETAKKETNHTKTEVEALSDKLKQAEKDNDEMRAEKDNLLAKVNEHKKTFVALSAALADNAKLAATVQELQDRIAASASSPNEEAVKTLQEKLRETEEKKSLADKALGEWTDLAKRSYREYKEMLPVYKQADRHRQENEQLKAQLAQAQSNSAGGGDAAYWRNKYDTLLASLE